MRTETSLLSLDARREVLDQALERACRTRRPVLVALATHPTRRDLRDHLLDAPTCPKLSWSEASSGLRMLGLGTTQAFSAPDGDTAWTLPDHAQEALEAAACPPEVQPLLRMFGGIAFDPTSEPHPAWPDGTPARFILPEALVYQTASEATVIVTHWAYPEDTLQDVLGRFEATIRRTEEWAASEASELPIAYPALPQGTRERWINRINTALARIRAEEVGKVVLSRDLPVRSNSPFPLGAVIRQLEAKATSGRVFGFQLSPQAAFVGATPELLVSTTGREVRSDCLAGTCRRTDDPEQDDRLALALLSSDKERREHQHVIAAVSEALAPLCEDFEVPETPALMVLPTLQHLHTPVRGKLREGVLLGTVLRRLHPTPAVGGTPRKTALAMIRELEERPRGWYAGAVGWIGSDAASFSVGIRSAILHPEGAIVFGGAGIVSGSDPASEWEETQRKAAPLLNLLTQGASE